MGIEPKEHRKLWEAQILNQIQESVITTDLDGYITSWNKGAERMYSYTSDEALGRHISLVYPEDEREFLQREVIAPLKEKGEHKSEVRLMRKSGEKFYALLLLALLRDENGVVTGMLGSSVDITQRKRAEEQLIESEERFRSSFEYAAIGMALVGMNGRFLKVNQSLCRIVGYSKEEFLNLTFQEITYPDDLDADLALSRKLFEGEIPSYKMEKRYIHKNGDIIWILLSGSVVRDADGKIIYAIAQIEDITDRKAVEEKLKKNEELFRTLFEILPVGVSIVDSQRRVLNTNQALERILGISAEQVLNGFFLNWKFLMDDGAPLSFEDLPSARAIREQKVVERSVIGIAKDDGKIIWTEVSAAPLRGAGAVVVTLDVTERKRAEEELRLQIERYDLVTAGVRDGIWDWDVPNKRVFFSGRWKAMRGFLEDEVSDSEEEWRRGIHPDDAPRVFASVKAHFEGKTPWFSEEYRVRCKDGTWMWVLDRGIALRDAAGRVVRMAGSETDITVRKRMEAEREKLIAELKEALAKVKTLSGLLPICSHCKKIRDDKGYWKQIEIYIRDRSEAEFSHGICPDCVKKFYPEQYDKIMEQGNER